MRLTNAGASVKAELVATLAVAAVAPRQIDTLGVSSARGQALGTLVHVCREQDGGNNQEVIRGSPLCDFTVPLCFVVELFGILELAC